MKEISLLFYSSYVVICSSHHAFAPSGVNGIITDPPHHKLVPIFS